MKTTLNSLLITAAGLTLSAVATYGQTKVVANIPFSFRTAAGMQEPGQYAVAPVTYDAAIMKLQNMHTGKSSIIGPGTPSGVSKESPKLVFRCGSESGCALSAVVIGDGRGWSYKAPHLKPSETERVAVVYFESKQAE
jgi:hypothetical protein